ncbi:MAG TPA: nucleotide exchange factor GrpE [Bacteroidales bacterium]|jgi:molecular chaperone GrpE|nr:nucleotide exchange factor GrpE [Bacteroidales bacterium]HOS15864.1 nucleotide exchange factor GrpE [Bacteroidales bacterium]
MEDNTINTDNQEQNKDINSNQQVRKEEVELQDIHKEEETQEKPKRGNMFAKKDKRMQQIEELKASTEKLQAEKAELQDKFLRLYSEFDNYRKRTQKEKLDIIKTASENIILNLLPIIDDMERAIAFNEKNQTDDVSVKEGLTLILQKLKTMLKQKGLAEIKTENEPFSTDFHEAISTVPAEKEEDKGKILEEIQKGYTLNDKVIRFSKVIIYQ